MTGPDPERRKPDDSPRQRTTRSRIRTRLLVIWLAVPLIVVLAIWHFYVSATSGPSVYRLPSWAPGGDATRPYGVQDENDLYLIGAGKADVTGPVVELNMMGYADPNQTGTGLRQRLYSRAFIMGSIDCPEDRFVYIVLDTQSGDTAVRYGILSGLSQLGPEYAVYGKHNIAVTATHSHSGPGAWLNYLLPQITSKGFDRQSYEAIVNGTLLSIQRAHQNLAPGHLSVGTTKVYGASINRSLYAFLANPEAERQRYNISAVDDGTVERDMTMLKFQRASDGKAVGVLTWFPTHGTSMLGNNTLISGDNKGVAADLLEKDVRGLDSATDDFVAGFSQASVGDVSPNVLGAWCEDGTGERCSFENSTCSDGRSQKCHARGPYFREPDNGALSCYEIGKRQYAAARDLFHQMDGGGTPVSGRAVKAFHVFHDMSFFPFVLPNGSEVQTCPAALGYSFAAGTTDGPGAFDFTQHGSNETTSPLWRVVSRFIKDPSPEQVECQRPKPILLDVGEMHEPYEWAPNIVDIQAFRVGQLVIVVSPGEATTMAGRRWKDAVKGEAARLFSDLGEAEPVVVLGGPANTYAHYIATEEEYGIQRYEGASTLYGPHTLAAYINRTLTFLPLLSSDSSANASRLLDQPYPPNNSNASLSFIPGVVMDNHPLFKPFGAVLRDVEPAYPRRATVSATFVGANPRNNLRLEGSYAAVEEQVLAADGTRTWRVVRDDSDWGLVYNWRRTSEVLGTSEVEIVWETAVGEQGSAEVEGAGTYRIKYFGDWKSLSGEITAFEGVSSEFKLG
ncbi:related to ceramidase [Cephalotrichum gorgonifer]|uniref:Neutral ceramidase n=1 Tax=Cephalotrichum gorgonifer TaxID=2041049 RepID=A0AAE8N7M1_9PEZI|nr:related to ceramidase [Cephalotrichum gorgonifer]